MNQPPQSHRRWQFGLRSLLLFSAITGPLAGLFCGTFGENNRTAAVTALAVSADYIFPLSWIAIIILMILGVAHLIGRLTGIKK